MNTPNSTLNLHGIKIDRNTLNQHMLITGTTGSGKTHGVIKPLLRQILAQGDAAVIFDVKGDLLEVVQEALQKCGRSADLVTLGIGPNDATFNPLSDDSLTPSQIVTQLITASSFSSKDERSRNEEMFWQNARVELLCSIVELARVKNRAEGSNQPISFLDLLAIRSQISMSSGKLKSWAAEVSDGISNTALAGLNDYAMLPDNTRGCVLNSVSSLIAPFMREPLSSFVNPGPGRKELKLPDILNQSKVVVVTGSNAELMQDLWPAFILFKQALYRFVLSRPRLKGVRQDNNLVICLDEYNRMISTADLQSSEHVALETARSSKTSFILAAQNLSGLEAAGSQLIVNKIAALCGTFCFLANNCQVTASLAHRCLGTKIVNKRHKSVSRRLPPPLLFAQDNFRKAPDEAGVTLVPVEEPVVSLVALSRLKTGVAHVKLVDGSVRKIQCTFN